MDAAIKIQRIVRGKTSRKLSEQKKAVIDAELQETKKSGVLIKGQRVLPWSDESARMAMLELNGKVAENGNILWPKGTVEKLLIERTSYADDLKEIKRKEAERIRASQNAKDVAQQTVNEVMKQLQREALLGRTESFDPTWTVQDWLGSLSLNEILSSSLLEHLRTKSTDPRFERGFIQRLGKAKKEEAETIVKNILENSSFVSKVAEAISAAAHVVAQEMSKKEKRGRSDGSGDKKPNAAGKFFDDTPQGSKQATFTLIFGDREDFFGGLEKLVGKPDPISLRAGIFKEHTARKDSKIDFTVGNYGTTTQSQYEYWFVVEPTDPILAKLGLREWPRDKKLYDDAESRKLCRRPKHPREFVQTLGEINGKLKEINQSITGDMFVGARLYTGPMFMKYNTILRAASGKVDFFVQQRDELVRGNKYSTTLHVINAALTTLSTLSHCQLVYRGVSGGMLPDSFNEPSPVDSFRGGVEYGFMSTTQNRAVAFEYAKGSAGIVFEMYMGMVDKGANLSAFSQYPHEAEICFPPLTALEVRGTRIDGSVTIVEVDARVCMTGVEMDTDQMIAVNAFRGADGDGSGELDLREFKRLALQLLPDVPDERLNEVFGAADQDGSGRIDFEEYRNVCIPMLKNEEVDQAKRREDKLKTQHQLEIKQAEEFVEENARKRMVAALAKQQKLHEKELAAKVEEQALFQRKSIADLAAEMLLGFSADRNAPTGARSRKCAMLAKALEDTAFTMKDIKKEVKARKAREERRRARSVSPERTAGDCISGASVDTKATEPGDASPALGVQASATGDATTSPQARFANFPNASTRTVGSKSGGTPKRSGSAPRSGGTPRSRGSTPRSGGGTPRPQKPFTPRLELGDFKDVPQYR